MNQGRAASNHRPIGFTLVELIIVMVVLGILVGVTVIAYRNIHRTATVNSVKNDLVNAADEVESSAALTGGQTYPTTVANVKTSPNVKLSIIPSNLPHYSGLNAVQNGVLLSQICQNLIDEGLGKGLNNGGSTDDYVTGCGNWNHDSMQVTGWTSHVFPTPVTSTTFTDYLATVPASDSYHPNQQKVVQNFYQQLHDRLTLEGGSYPVTSFWDYWAAPGNGGVPMQSLPTSDATVPGQYYCIQAIYNNDSSYLWHIRNNGVPFSGSC